MEQGDHAFSSHDGSDRRHVVASFPPLPPSVTDLGPIIDVTPSKPPVVHTEEVVVRKEFILPVRSTKPATFSQGPVYRDADQVLHHTPPSGDRDSNGHAHTQNGTQNNAPDLKYSAPSTHDRGQGDLPTPPDSPPAQREVHLPITPHLLPKVDRSEPEPEAWEKDWRKPTIKELIPPREMTVEEMNGLPNPNDPDVLDIQVHLLKEYEEEARRRALEEDVHRREIELDKIKDKERIVSGLDNADLHALVRSFDKQVQNVHVCPPPYDGHIPKGLDLHPHPDEEFSVGKLTSALERLYSSVVVGVLRVVHELNRIRNWEDGGDRTMVAMVVYIYAWWCHIILLSILVFVSILIFFPSSRTYFFLPRVHPSAPPEDVNTDNTIKIAKRRVDDPWGPAGSEAAASSWAQNVQDIVSSLATPQGGGKEASQITDGAHKVVVKRLDEDMEKREQVGNLNEGDHEMKRKDKAIKLYAQPGMRFIAGFADKWERVANALSPAPGYMLRPRRLDVFFALVAPLILAVTFTTGQMVSRGMGAAFGFMLFANPLLGYIIDELDRTIPDWKERLILEHNLFETVPTNSQIVLKLLREAEHKGHPITPPIFEYDAEDDEEDSAFDESEDEDEEHENGGLDDEPDQGKTKQATQAVTKVGAKATQGARAKVRRAWDKLGRAKEEGFGVITGHRHIDLEGKAEHTMDKMHINKEGKTAQKLLDKLPTTDHEDSPEDPSCFYVHHHRHGPGHIVIYPPLPQANTPARIEFTTVRRVPASQNTPVDPRDAPSKGHLIVPINDITGLKKVGRSMPARIAIGWALNAEGAGGVGLEISVVRRNQEEAVRGHRDEAGVPLEPTVAQGKEDTVKLTGIVRRNELFDRLVALGDQRWEMH